MGGKCKAYSAIGGVIDTIEALEEGHSVDACSSVAKLVAKLIATR